MAKQGTKQSDAFSRRSVRNALKQWHSPSQLARHPLAALNIVEVRRRAAARPNTADGIGMSLRDVLREALERLRPDNKAPDYKAEAWCPYIILKEQYVNGRHRDYLVQLLQSVSTHRTYHRIQNQALDRVADTLRRWESESRLVPKEEEHPAPFLAPPKPPYRIVGRYPVLQAVKGRLLAGGGAFCALNGLPGVGKTALAIELAHDPDILSHFDDGILWAGLGREPNRLALLGLWGAALGISAQAMARLTTEAERAQAVHRAVGMRCMLLIIDDAWRLADALAFRLGGPNCAYLLTTRLSDLAQDFAEEGAMVVNELSDAGGLLLLGQLAAEVTDVNPDAAQELVRAVGGLPLAIILMARYIRHAAHQGLRSLELVLEQLRNAEERLRLEMPQGLLGSHPSLPVGTPLSLSAAVHIGEAALDEATRRAFYALSVFPPKPNTFSKEAALHVADGPVQALNGLVGHGFLEPGGPARYTLHQTLADYARLRLSDNHAHERLVAYFVAYVERHQNDYGALDQETTNILAALQTALNQGMSAALVKGVNAFYGFMEVRGLYSQAQDYLNEAEQAARTAGDRSGLVQTLLSLGKVTTKQGSYAQAEAYLQEGLDLARKLGHRESISALLINLAVVESKRGAYDLAEAYYQESLELAQGLGHREQISLLLSNLGALAGRRGAYEQAETYFQEGLALARKLGHRDRISALLSNLGTLAEKRGAYGQAETYYQEALQLAQASGHRERISFLLTNLGAIADLQGAYDEAERYYQEGLELARALGHREIISVLLFNLGFVAMKTGSDDQAEAYYQKSLEVAQEIGHHETIVDSLRHLAAIDVRRGEYEQAEVRLQEGLTLAQGSGHREDTSATLIEWGELYLEQQSWDSAKMTFDQALAIAEEIGNQGLIAGASFGLAQVALAQGDITEAQRWGQASLAIFESMGNVEVAEVKAWLSGI